MDKDQQRCLFLTGSALLSLPEAASSSLHTDGALSKQLCVSVHVCVSVSVCACMCVCVLYGCECKETYGGEECTVDEKGEGEEHETNTASHCTCVCACACACCISPLTHPIYCSGWLWWITILHVGHVLLSSRYFTRQLLQTGDTDTHSQGYTLRYTGQQSYNVFSMFSAYFLSTLAVSLGDHG